MRERERRRGAIRRVNTYKEEMDWRCGLMIEEEDRIPRDNSTGINPDRIREKKKKKKMKK